MKTKIETIERMDDSKEYVESAGLERVKDFFRAASGDTDPNVFYFSLGGLVMPLSRRV